MSCFYEYGEKQLVTRDLLKEFYKDNLSIKDSSIFSSEELIGNTLTKLNKLKEEITPNKFDNNKNPNVTEFITSKNYAFNRIEGLQTDRITPEFILEKFIGQYVKDNILNAQYLYLEDNPEINDLYNKVITAFPELEQEDKGKVKYLINEQYQDHKDNEINMHFGSDLHSLVYYKIKGQEDFYNTRLDEILSNPIYEQLFSKGSTNQWKTQIGSIINSVFDSVKNTGEAITNVRLIYNNINNEEDTFALKGRLDLVAIDSKGNPHIFEIKVSKNSYTSGKWNSAKLLSLDYELAFYKQLLGQHTDVSKTELYVLPITIGTNGDPTSLKFEGIHNRNTESKNGIRQGKIETIANRIVPLKIHPEYNPDRSNIFRGKLEKLLWVGYEPKLRFNAISLENMLKHVTDNQKKKGGKFSFYNNYEEIAGLKHGLIEADTIEEMTPLVKIFLAHEEKNKTKKVVALKSAISDAIRSNNRISTNNDNYDYSINNLVRQYLNDDWEVISDFEETDALGLILLRNKKDGQVNPISISANQFLSESQIDGYTEGDIEYMKVLMFLNEYKKDLLPYTTNKFGNIVIYNPENLKPYVKTIGSKFDQFANLLSKQGFKSNDLKLSLNNNFIDPLTQSLQELTNYENSIGDELGGEENKSVSDIILKLKTTNNINLEFIKELVKEFEAAYPQYKDKVYKTDINFDDKKEVIYALLNVALSTAYRADFGADFQNISNPGANFSDFRDLLSAFWTDKHPTYDKEGRRITGILQGLLFQTPDWTPSKDVRKIDELISNGISRIRELDLEGSEKIGKITSKYYDDINFSSTSRLLIGKTNDKYENLWLKKDGKKDGKISNEFKTKNPYKNDLDNSLEPPEEEFLKKMLFEINIYALGLNEKEARKLNPMDLSSLLRNETIAKAIESGKYFDMPLIKREDHTRSIDFKSPKQIVGDIVQQVDHGMTAEDVKNFDESNKGLTEMYDVYASHTPEYKVNAINKYGTGYFEVNLDTIAHRVMFNKTRKYIFDNIFPVLGSMIWQIKVFGGKSNDDITNIVEHIRDQVKLAAFGQHIIDKDFKDIITANSMMKKIITPMMIGLKPASFVKELTIGTWKGIALAATEMYGKNQFTVSDLTKAYVKMTTIDNKFSNEFNLIDRINQFYGFANMDANTIAQKMQTDRHGIFRFMSRYMYAGNTVPDYYNRLSLFLAKMIHDGSYEAHSLVDGVFTYNPKKDDRFSYYLENRGKYQGSNGEYLPSKDVKYNEQRRHYLLVMSQINEESAISGEHYTEKDLLPKAYSEKERRSFKTFTDMAYGYYDKDAQDQISNKWYGQIWLSLMQYWPGKMKMWFARPETAETSAMGSIKQKTRVEEDGTLTPLWLETYIKEDGTTDVRETTENTGDPCTVWTGTPFEGLMYSCFSVVRDIAKLDFGKVKDDKQRLHRVAFAINDTILMYIIFMLFKMMFDVALKDNPDGMSNELLSFGKSISSKVANEQNFYDSTLGALRSDPAWLSWSKKFATNMHSTFEGNKTFMNGVSSIGALEMFREQK